MVHVIRTRRASYFDKLYSKSDILIPPLFLPETFLPVLANKRKTMIS